MGQPHIKGLTKSFHFYRKETEAVDISPKNDQTPMCLSDILETMKSGTPMTAYFVRQPKQDVVLYCRNEILFVCPHHMDDLGHALEAIPLNSIMLLCIGKQTPALVEQARRIRSGLCFSLKGAAHGKTVTLELQASSKELIKVWLRGIQHLLALSKAEVRMVSEGILSVSAQRDDPKKPVEVKYTRSLSTMTRGMTMTAFSRNNVCKRVTLHCHHSVLYVCEEGERVEDALLSFPLDSITDIYLGKQTREFETPLARYADETKCFSIIAKYSLHLSSDTSQQLESWVNGLKYLLKASTQKQLVFNETSPSA